MSDSVYEVDYVFLIPGKTFSHNFLLSWTQTLGYLNSKGLTHVTSIYYNPIVSITRNRLLGLSVDKQFTKNTQILDGKIKCKKIIFIDSDIVWTIEDIERLINSKEKFVSGAYSFHNGKYVVAMKRSLIMLTHEELKEKTDLFEVESVGLGFFAADFEALKDIDFPWFDIKIFMGTDTECLEDSIAEDQYFCNKIRDAGYKIYLDPNIKLGHEKTWIVGFDKGEQ